MAKERTCLINGEAAGKQMESTNSDQHLMTGWPDTHIRDPSIEIVMTDRNEP